MIGKRWFDYVVDGIYATGELVRDCWPMIVVGAIIIAAVML